MSNRQQERLLDPPVNIYSLLSFLLIFGHVVCHVVQERYQIVGLNVPGHLFLSSTLDFLLNCFTRRVILTDLHYQVNHYLLRHVQRLSEIQLLSNIFRWVL